MEFLENYGVIGDQRTRAQRIRSSISAGLSGLYANTADVAARWWRHPYVKAAATAAAAFILYTILVVVPLSVALGHCKKDLTPGPTGPTPGPNPEIPCGIQWDPVGPHVINGDQASPHAFPWMAIVEERKHGYIHYFKRNAALIHKYFVVTTNLVSPGDVVVLGAHNHSDTSEVTRQKFVIEAVFIHPNLSANLPGGGMRLAKLCHPVNFNKYINRVCPPKRHFIPAAGSSCKIAGWGNNTGPNDLLHEGSLRIISNDQCKRDMPTWYHDYITNATFCTAVDETHTHPKWDDVGSPLLCEQEKGVFGVYGVLFFAGHSYRPSVFYNVTAMDSWMDELFPQYNAE